MPLCRAHCILTSRLRHATDINWLWFGFGFALWLANLNLGTELIHTVRAVPARSGCNCTVQVKVQFTEFSSGK